MSDQSGMTSSHLREDPARAACSRSSLLPGFHASVPHLATGSGTRSRSSAARSHILEPSRIESTGRRSARVFIDHAWGVIARRRRSQQLTLYTRDLAGRAGTRKRTHPRGQRVVGGRRSRPIR